MASRSKAAQEKLVELDKAAAPFEEFMIEAAKFIGVEIQDVEAAIAHNSEATLMRKNLYGRDEWLLRWLLKKLQAQEDDQARKESKSWQLLAYTSKAMSVSSLARILNEKKLIAIVRQSLEEAKSAEAKRTLITTYKQNPPSPSSHQHENNSKKRKRSEQPCPGRQVQLGEWMKSIFAMVSHVVIYTKPLNTNNLMNGNSRLAAEHMKTVIRTTSEEAARILGAWMSLSGSMLEVDFLDASAAQSWLSIFVAIWEVRALDDNDLMQFSLHCSQPLLSLLHRLNRKNIAKSAWQAQLEQLVARNIIIPAKLALFDKSDPELLSTLTRVSVLQDPANAVILFEIAIRSIQNRGSRRRRPQDAEWLQTVFTNLKDAMPPRSSKEQNVAISCMLSLAGDYKVDLDLSILRDIVTTYVLRDDNTDWTILSTVIKLDANVFLIPQQGKDFLGDVLKRVTKASFDASWLVLNEKVVTGIVLPLMKAFARARDLTGFIREHWYSELVSLQQLRSAVSKDPVEFLSAWEDYALHTELRNLLEVSLTMKQINQLLDWLASQVSGSPSAVCVILEAMSASIIEEDIVDGVGLRLYQIMFGDGAYRKLDEQYKQRAWRIITHNLANLPQTLTAELANLWERKVQPFDDLADRPLGSSNISSQIYKRDYLEELRFTCAAWSVANGNGPLAVASKDAVSTLLNSVVHDTRALVERLKDPSSILGTERCGPGLSSKHVGFGRQVWAYVHCCVVEYPKVLHLLQEIGGAVLRNFLQQVIWIASAARPDDPSQDLPIWLKANHQAWSISWMAALNMDEILSNAAVIGHIIELVLSEETYNSNPFLAQTACDQFAVQSLLRLPIQVIHPKQRASIMQRWSFPTRAKISIVSPAVLSLRLKLLQRPTFYEHMTFKDLLELVKLIEVDKDLDLELVMSLVKELSRLILLHINANKDRRDAYLWGALEKLKENLSPLAEQDKCHPAMIFMFEPLVAIFIQTDLASTTLPATEVKSVLRDVENRLLHELTQTVNNRPPDKHSISPTDALRLLSLIDVLTTMRVDPAALTDIYHGVETYLNVLRQVPDFEDPVSRIESLLSVHISRTYTPDVQKLSGSMTTASGRQLVADRTRALLSGKNGDQKLEILKSALGEDHSKSLMLHDMLAVKYMIYECEDTRAFQKDDMNDSATTFDLSVVYSRLCNSLCRCSSLRAFCLLSETLDMMLKIKPRVVTQWNINTTLSNITVICSRQGPSLNGRHSAPIYMHLCALLRTILLSSSHRSRLQGHFHLLLQTMQSLLRCLFLPLPNSSQKSSAFSSSPPWLSSSHPLTAAHSAAFTRLLTSICDPTISSVSRPHRGGMSKASLTSATDKAKKIAAPHMQYLLPLYIKGSLEMRMLPEVRRALVPGIYTLFDATDKEMRRALGEGLDASGRAVFGTMVRDWAKFGRWGGS